MKLDTFLYRPHFKRNLIVIAALLLLTALPLSSYAATHSATYCRCRCLYTELARRPGDLGGGQEANGPNSVDQSIELVVDSLFSQSSSSLLDFDALEPKPDPPRFCLDPSGDDSEYWWDLTEVTDQDSCANTQGTGCHNGDCQGTFTDCQLSTGVGLTR